MRPDEELRLYSRMPGVSQADLCVMAHKSYDGLLEADRVMTVACVKAQRSLDLSMLVCSDQESLDDSTLCVLERMHNAVMRRASALLVEMDRLGL